MFFTDVLSIRSFFYFEQTDVAIVTCLGVFFILEGGNRKKGAHMRIINKFVDWICALFSSFVRRINFYASNTISFTHCTDDSRPEQEPRLKLERRVSLRTQ